MKDGTDLTRAPEFAVRFRCPACGKTLDAATRDEIQFLVTAWPECCDGVMTPSVRTPPEERSAGPASLNLARP